MRGDNAALEDDAAQGDDAALGDDAAPRCSAVLGNGYDARG